METFLNGGVFAFGLLLSPCGCYCWRTEMMCSKIKNEGECLMVLEKLMRKQILEIAFLRGFSLGYLSWSFGLFECTLFWIHYFFFFIFASPALRYVRVYMCRDLFQYTSPPSCPTNTLSLSIKTAHSVSLLLKRHHSRGIFSILASRRNLALKGKK